MLEKHAQRLKLTLELARNVQQVEKVVLAALPTAREAIDAYIDLSQQQPQVVSSDARLILQKNRIELPMRVHELATMRMLRIEAVLHGGEYRNLGVGHDGTTSPDAIMERIAGLKELKKEIATCEGLMRDACLALELTSKSDIAAGALVVPSGEKMREQVSRVRHLASLDIMLLQLHRVLLFSDLPPDVRAGCRELSTATAGAATLAFSAAQAHRMDGTATRSAALRGLERVDRLADQFAVRTVQAWNGPAEHWQGMLAYADSVQQVLVGLRDAARGEMGLSRERGGADDAPMLPAAASPSGVQRSEGRRQKVSRSEMLAQSHSTAAIEGLRSAVLNKAHQMLEKRGLTLEIAHHFDCGSNAVMPQGESRIADPTEVANAARKLVRSRFGRMEPLNNLLEQLRMQLDQHPSDNKLQETISQVEHCRQALSLLSQRIRNDESDALKCHATPTASHLQRLLRMQEIASVSQLKKLNSVGDEGDRGTLFEMKIQPKPLVNGDAVPPLYLHLHTPELVIAEECRAMSFEAFTAVHVKNEVQRGLGRRWEELQKAFGRADMKVHRGEVDESLLRDLLAFEVAAPR